MNNWKPYRDQDKPFTLTAKEVARATLAYHGKRYTIVSRPQADGTYFVGAVWVESGYPVDCCACVKVPKSDIQAAVKDANRWMDKLAMGGEMSSESRHRDAKRHAIRPAVIS